MTGVNMFTMERKVASDMQGMHPAEITGRPRLLLAYADAAYASECGRYFRRLGWEVEMVASGVEARELASEYLPNVVALEVALLHESGWLTSAKLSTENPDLRIILVAADQTDCTPDRLSMVGALKAVRREDGAAALASSILGNVTLSEAV